MDSAKAEAYRCFCACYLQTAVNTWLPLNIHTIKRS